MILVLPLPPEVLHPNGRTRNHNYRAAMVRKTRGETALVARMAPDKPSEPWKAVTIQATFHLEHDRDGDGLNGWIKAVIDGLQGIVIKNDRGVTLLPPLKVVGGERKLELRIEPLGE